MENTIRVNDAICIRCGRCVKVCPSQIFVQEKAGAAVTLHKPENCIVCGHCAAACPTGAVEHADFPAEKVHPIDYAALPTPEQVELLLAVRRSNRAFSQRPVPQEYLDRIVAAADMGPISLHGSSIAAGDTITIYDEEEPTVIYDTGDEYAWINKLDAGEALAVSSVFMDTPQFCLVLSDGTVLQIAQSGEDSSLLLYEE